MSKPRRKASKPKLKVVGHIGTPDSVLSLLDEAMSRAANDETLAIAIIEVRREGEILKSWTQDDGFRHQLYAGCGYLMTEIASEDE